MHLMHQYNGIEKAPEQSGKTGKGTILNIWQFLLLNNYYIIFSVGRSCTFVRS